MSLKKNIRLTTACLLGLYVLTGCVDGQKSLGSNCKVNDPDISGDYSGGCKDGLAHGEGVAKGRDEYRGTFHRGDAHGFGVYSWGDSSKWATERYEGWHFSGARSGYGVDSIDENSDHVDIEVYKFEGTREGGRLVTRGIWLDHHLVHLCESETGCIKSFAEKAKRDSVSEPVASENSPGASATDV